jgi:hypothetical protein
MSSKTNTARSKSSTYEIKVDITGTLNDRIMAGTPEEASARAIELLDLLVNDAMSDIEDVDGVVISVEKSTANPEGP